MPLLLFLFLIWIAGFETVTYMLQVMFFFLVQNQFANQIFGGLDQF
jgi:hypothetical protein